MLEARVPTASEAPERVLAERVLEELEGTREARERRAEQLADLADDVAAGNVIDLSKVALTGLPMWTPPPSIVVPDGQPRPPQE